MIEAIDLHKSYGKTTALYGVSFKVNRGEIFGIIGPDGSGKTTLLRILGSLLLPDSGSVQVNGFDAVKDFGKIRKIIGYMPERFSLYQDLSVEENLRFFATVFNTSFEENYFRIEDIYHQIEPFKGRRTGALSGGMKQKLALSCALVHSPTILLLDEPTTGVDPVSRKEFWDILKKLQSEGITAIVSTAYMDEASLCNRIALMRKGTFVATDSPHSLINNYQEILWKVRTDRMPASLFDLRNHPQVKTCFAFGNCHHVTVCPELSMPQLTSYLEKLGYNQINIAFAFPSVEDCFMAITHQSPPAK